MVFGTKKIERLTKIKRISLVKMSSFHRFLIVLVVLSMILPGCKISDSGKSSKFEVSSMLLIPIGIAAGLSLQNGIE